MATDKPRFSVTFTEDSFAKIQEYQRTQKISTQSKAVARLVELAIQEIKGEKINDNATNRLSSSEQSHIKKYRTLDEYGKKMVDTVLDLECEQYAQYQKKLSRKKVQRGEIRRKRYPIPVYYIPMSAGIGVMAIDENQETASLVKEPPYGADFIAPVRGDSMEPDFHDGDMVFVKSTPTIEIGEVGVFLQDGEQYIKELGHDVLISRNPEYEDIPLMEETICWGLVLGICDDSYFG